jgi:hypothetical protein
VAARLRGSCAGRRGRWGMGRDSLTLAS